MRDELQDQVRRYAQAVDEDAPPIEELVPPGMADELGIDRTRIEVSVPLRPAPPRRKAPGWAIALAAAAVVLLIAVPLWLSLNTTDSDVVETVASTTPMTPTTAVAPLMEPSLTFDRATHQMSGTAWPVGATVKATVGDVERTAVVSSDGSFLMEPANFSDCCFHDLVVTDGQTTITLDSVPNVAVMRVDPDRDIVSGSTDLPNAQVQLRIVGATDEMTTTVPAIDGSWFVDLTGEFDLLTGMVVEATVDYPGITVVDSSTERIAPGIGLRLAGNELTGESLAPMADVSVSIDGLPLGGEVTSDERGQFSLNLDDYGLSLAPGTIISVEDGISHIESSVPLLTYDRFDPIDGVASGVTNLRDGSELYLELWMTDGRSEEPDRYATYNGIVSNGSWMIHFDPVPATWTVLVTDVGGVLDELTTVDFVLELD